MVSIGAEFLVELGEPAFFLRVGQAPLVDKLHLRIGDVAGKYGVPTGDVIRANDSMEDHMLGLSG